MNTLERNDGAIIAYRDIGRGSPIICIHGWGTSGDFFQQQIDGLSVGHRLVVPDLRGHGQSSHFTTDLDFQVLADDLQALMEKLDVTDALLVGWSLGAMVAWDLLARHGEARVSGLVSVDMVPRLLNDADWSYGLRDGLDGGVFQRSVEKMRADWPAYTRVFIPRIFARDGDADEAQIAWACERSASNDAESMARVWQSMVDQDLRGALTSIGLPSLVIYGEKSRLYQPAGSHWLAETLADGRAIGFAQSGHAPNLEQAELFNQTVGEFADQLNSSPKRPESKAD